MELFQNELGFFLSAEKLWSSFNLFTSSYIKCLCWLWNAFGIQLNGSWRGMECYWRDKNKKFALTDSVVGCKYKTFNATQNLTSARTKSDCERCKFCGKAMSVVSGEMCSFFFCRARLRSDSKRIWMDLRRFNQRHFAIGWRLTKPCQLKIPLAPCRRAKARVIFTSVGTFSVCCRSISLARCFIFVDFIFISLWISNVDPFVCAHTYCYHGFYSVYCRIRFSIHGWVVCHHSFKHHKK